MRPDAPADRSHRGGIVTALLFLGAALAATPVDPTAAVKALEAHYAKVDSLTADFTQVVHNYYFENME